MRLFTPILILLALAPAYAGHMDYSSSRRWVEQRCETNAIPEGERIFVGRIWSPQYAGIIRFHKGITLREIIDQTPFKGKVVKILVLRAKTPVSPQYIRVEPSETLHREVKALDMIWIYDDVPIVDT